MTNILVADQDIKEINKINSYFNNKIDFKIISTINGLSALEEYKKIRPDIFILATNLKDINYNEIIRQISYNYEEILNCNTILISDFPNQISQITNIAKLYDFFVKPFDYQDMFNTVEEMSNHNLDKKIDLLFLKTRIPLRSTASDRVRKAITKCYYSPEIMSDLNHVFTLVADELKTTNDAIRSSFRTTLKPLNLIKNNDNIPKFAIFNFFEKGENVTPKDFLKVSTYYLHNIKNTR